MSMVVQQTLRQLCCGTGWEYVVFWKLNRNSMRLMWEDGYYNSSNAYLEQGRAKESAGVLREKLGESIARFSFHVYAFGEGIIGRVAFTNKYQWVFTPCDGQGCEVGMRSNSLNKFPAEWQTQFLAGIKTIAVISVPGGVVQFGSSQIIPEDLSLVQFARGSFDQLQAIPDAFLPDDLPASPSAQSPIGQWLDLGPTSGGPGLHSGTATLARLPSQTPGGGISHSQPSEHSLSQTGVKSSNPAVSDDGHSKGWAEVPALTHPWKSTSSAATANKWSSWMTEDLLFSGRSPQDVDSRIHFTSGPQTVGRKLEHPSAVSPSGSSEALNGSQRALHDHLGLPNGSQPRGESRSTARLPVGRIALKALESDGSRFWDSAVANALPTHPLLSVDSGHAGRFPSPRSLTHNPVQSSSHTPFSSGVPVVLPGNLQLPGTSRMNGLSEMCNLPEVPGMGFSPMLLSTDGDLFRAMDDNFPQLEEVGPQHLNKLVHSVESGHGRGLPSVGLSSKIILPRKETVVGNDCQHNSVEDHLIPTSFAMASFGPNVLPGPTTSNVLSSHYTSKIDTGGCLVDDLSGGLAFSGQMQKTMQYSTLKSFDEPSDLTAPSKRPWEAYMGPESTLVGYELFEALGTAMTGQKTTLGTGLPVLDCGATQQEALVSAPKVVSSTGPAIPLSFSSRGASKFVDSVLAGIASTVEPVSTQKTDFEMPRLPPMDSMTGLMFDMAPAAGSNRDGPTFGIQMAEGTSGNHLQRPNFGRSLEPIAAHNDCDSPKLALGCDLGASAVAKVDSFDDDMGEDMLRDDSKRCKKKSKGKTGEGPRPRPKDRQQIQDRVKDLRGIIPNSQKLSIDGLLDKTIEHMKFLRETIGRHKRYRMEEEDYGGKHRKCLADAMSPGASISNGVSVHLLREPWQFLVEVKCDINGMLLEVAEVLKSLKLVIRRGVCEAHGGNLWGRYIVQAMAPIERATIYWVLVQKLKQHEAAEPFLASPSGESNTLEQQQACSAYLQSRVHGGVDELGSCAFPVPGALQPFESRFRTQCC